MLPRVTSIHGLEHARGAGLDRQMQMGHDSRHLGHGVDGLGQEVLRVRGGEGDTFHAGIANAPQQLSEARLTKEVAPVGVDVLPEQRDLAHTLSHEPRHLVEHLLHGPALLAPAHVGDNAVGAEVVATRHDGDPRMVARRTVPGHAGGIDGLVLLGAHLAPTLLEGIRDQLPHMRDGMRAEDDVDVIDVREQPLAIALRDATAHRDHARAGRRGRQALAGVALTVEARVGGLAHAAGHEDDDIGLSGFRDLEGAERVEEPAHALGVV